MFLIHQSEIQKFAAASDENTFKVLRFVQVTIQQRFDSVPKMIEELNTTGSVKRLTGRQRDAIEVYSTQRKIVRAKIFGSDSVLEKLLFVASLPGFGLAKAGFVLQLCIGRVGCLDVHNLRKFNLKASAFTLRPGSKQNVVKAEKYINFCENVVGTAHLWDQWCQFIAAKYLTVYVDAEHVSRLHVDCIKSQN